MSENNFDLIIPLWERAKELEKSLPAMKRDTFQEIIEEFPELTYRNFGSVRTAYKGNKLPQKITKLISDKIEAVNEVEDEAKKCREESERLIQLKKSLDTRKILNPSKAPIPKGKYQKLKECLRYPLRQDCNYGENHEAKWERCEFMKYDNSQSISSFSRWQCTAPET